MTGVARIQNIKAPTGIKNNGIRTIPRTIGKYLVTLNKTGG